MNTQILDLNDRAEAHLQKQEWSAALALFQKVFLDFSRADDPIVRAQVARALWGAAQCSRSMGDAKRAEQITATLERRYGTDDHSRVRYYLELARGNPAPPTTENEFATEPAQLSPENWDDFLSANGLDEAETPAQLAAPLSSPSVSPLAFIAENDVSIEGLKALFDAAFIENSPSGPDELMIVPDGTTRVFVSLNETNKLVHFSAFYGLRKFAKVEDKHQLVNRLNDEIIFVRFAVSDDTTIVGDYYLPYVGGILPQQIIHAARLLVRITSTSPKNLDEHDCLA